MATRGTNFWLRTTRRGASKFRTVTKVLITLLPFLLAGLLYQALVLIEDLEKGPEIIVAMAYGVGILVWMLIQLLVIVSLIEYLNKFD